MAVLHFHAAEFDDGPGVAGPDGPRSTAIVALARARSSTTLECGPAPAGPLTFSVYVRTRRSSPAAITLGLMDDAGGASKVVALSPEWVRVDLTYDVSRGPVRARIDLGADGESVPVLTDALYGMAQVEPGYYPTSYVASASPSRRSWVVFGTREAAIEARAEADAIAGLPSEWRGIRQLTTAPLLRHPKVGPSPLVGRPLWRRLDAARVS